MGSIGGRRYPPVKIKIYAARTHSHCQDSQQDDDNFNPEQDETFLDEICSNSDQSIFNHQPLHLIFYCSVPIVKIPWDPIDSYLYQQT